MEPGIDAHTKPTEQTPPAAEPASSSTPLLTRRLVSGGLGRLGAALGALSTRLGTMSASLEALAQKVGSEPELVDQPQPQDLEPATSAAS